MADAPIFLAGIDRSGIGLLGEVLEAHPDVAVTRRINFWDFYAGRFDDLGDPQQLDRCIGVMMQYTRIQRLQPDLERWKSDFVAGEASDARLFQLLQEQNLERLGKGRWCDKSLGAEGHAEEILSAFPDAVMVHVIRDPRDRYASRSNHRPADRGGPGSGVAAWLWSARLAQRHHSRFPGRYLPIRYEDLVRQPRLTVESVCRLAGLPFSPAMLYPHGSGGTAQSAGSFHDGSLGRFRRDLKPGEIRFIERIAGAEMKYWGYAPSEVTWTSAQKMRFAALELPVAVAGLVLWRPWAKLKGWVGARPSSRRTRPAG